MRTIIYGRIYILTNSINDKVYIGQTVFPLHKRMLAHVRAARAGKRTLLCHAIRKHGADKFNISLLCECETKAELDEREMHFISLYGGHNDRCRNYNMKHGGANGSPSEEIKRKQSEMMAGRYRGEKNPFFGKHHTSESIQKNSENRKGKHSGAGHYMHGKALPEYIKKAISEKNRITFSSPEWKERLSKKNSGDKNPGATVLSVEEKSKIIEMRKIGHSIRHIAKSLGITEQVAGRTCRELAPQYFTKIKNGHKLSVDDVKNIRARGGIKSALAVEYGVSVSTIDNIINYRCFKGIQ